VAISPEVVVVVVVVELILVVVVVLGEVRADPYTIPLTLLKLLQVVQVVALVVRAQMVDLRMYSVSLVWGLTLSAPGAAAVESCRAQVVPVELGIIMQVVVKGVVPGAVAAPAW
jgi:hypothetical protein